MKYRVAVLCGECGEAYRTRAKEDREAPDRCKKCGSSKTVVHPRPEESNAFEVPMRFIPVDD